MMNTVKCKNPDNCALPHCDCPPTGGAASELNAGLCLGIELTGEYHTDCNLLIKEIYKLRQMIDEGLGWEDLQNDVEE